MTSAVAMLIGDAAVNALALIGSNYFFSHRGNDGMRHESCGTVAKGPS